MKALMTSLIFLFCGTVFAQSPAGLGFEKAIVFAPLKGTRVSVGYMTLNNPSAEKMTVTIKSMEGFKTAEMHETVHKDGKMSMEKLDSVEIPAKGSLEFKEGGRHIMLFDPTRELKVGEKIKAVFQVNGKEVPAEFEVKARVAGEDKAHHHH